MTWKVKKRDTGAGILSSTLTSQMAEIRASPIVADDFVGVVALSNHRTELLENAGFPAALPFVLVGNL
jgi:hypothetical protein